MVGPTVSVRFFLGGGGSDSMTLGRTLWMGGRRSTLLVDDRNHPKKPRNLRTSLGTRTRVMAQQPTPTANTALQLLLIHWKGNVDGYNLAWRQFEWQSALTAVVHYDWRRMLSMATTTTTDTTTTAAARLPSLKFYYWDAPQSISTTSTTTITTTSQDGQEEDSIMMSKQPQQPQPQERHDESFAQSLQYVQIQVALDEDLEEENNEKDSTRYDDDHKNKNKNNYNNNNDKKPPIIAFTKQGPESTAAAAAATTVVGHNDHQNNHHYHHQDNFGFVLHDHHIQRATQRCALIHATYRIVAQGTNYEQLTTMALQSKDLHDLQQPQSPPPPQFPHARAHSHATTPTWSLRVRQFYHSPPTSGHQLGHYHDDNPDDSQHSTPPPPPPEQQTVSKSKQRPRRCRHGPKQSRSVSQERLALQAMKPLLQTLVGQVDLEHPDCELCVFEGIRPTPVLPCVAAATATTTTPGRLSSMEQTAECQDQQVQEQQHQQQQQAPLSNQTPSLQLVLARRIATGSLDLSQMAPKTRVCQTSTPLCPIAAYSLCNAAQIQPHSKLLDPYSGSSAILLAAAQIEPTVRSIAIEVQDYQTISRVDIQRDFTMRQLPPPLALLHGDSSDPKIRQLARSMLQSTSTASWLSRQEKQNVPNNQRHGDSEEEPPNHLSLAAASASRDNNDAEGEEVHKTDDDDDDDDTGGFDCILTDPPYGLREWATSQGTQDRRTYPTVGNYGKRAIQELLEWIEYDRTVVGQRLLRKGGKLVCLLPCGPKQQHEQQLEQQQQEQDRPGQSFPNDDQYDSKIHGPLVWDILPTAQEMDRAGVKLVAMREQYLHKRLSRWLVVFDCIK
ncbi:hypothetical protein ACA910_006546 [Epithemia clementina (nom. ined.)]